MTIHELQKECLPTVTPEDFFVLLAHATDQKKVFLLAHPEYTLTPPREKKIREYLKRRLNHEPVAYIIGHKEFYGREFFVTKNTLIPRPETELLVERVLNTIKKDARKIKNRKEVTLFDLGTGSGNIIISLAKEIQSFRLKNRHFNFFASDISSSALALAKKNAKCHDIDKHITFLKSDLLKNYSPPKNKTCHCIMVANLPYLSTDIYETSSRDIRDYEPRSALLSASQGLKHYLHLLSEIKFFSSLYLSTTFFLEISPEQSILLKEKIVELFPDSHPLIYQDLSGRNRLIQASL